MVWKRMKRRREECDVLPEPLSPRSWKQNLFLLSTHKCCWVEPCPYTRRRIQRNGFGRLFLGVPQTHDGLKDEWITSDWIRAPSTVSQGKVFSFRQCWCLPYRLCTGTSCPEWGYRVWERRRRSLQCHGTVRTPSSAARTARSGLHTGRHRWDTVPLGKPAEPRPSLITSRMKEGSTDIPSWWERRVRAEGRGDGGSLARKNKAFRAREMGPVSRDELQNFTSFAFKWLHTTLCVPSTFYVQSVLTDIGVTGEVALFYLWLAIIISYFPKDHTLSSLVNNNALHH